MKTVIYLDVLIIINLIIAYFMLLCVKIITNDQSSRKRLFLGGVCAALSSLIILAPTIPLSLQILYKISTGVCIVFVAFKWTSKIILLKKILWYLIFNFLLAGFIIFYTININANTTQVNNLSVYYNISPLTLLSCVMAVYLFMKLLVLLFGTPKKERIYKFTIHIKDIDIKVNTLWDTGFRLQDYITQKPVILVSIKHLADNELIGLVRKYFNDLDLPLESGYSFRLMMIKTANGESLLPSITAQEITLISDFRTVKAYGFTVAFTEIELENGYNALTGTSFINSFGI